ncbi:unnamed protein product [Polarella glacialis]|uniref:Uncharacterized protein n=1 Tax=Polarella glacialis TaxID=89957 RepID=A0A813LA70_POLGL|nr:unnamed protein product [Polarella glacialis]
MGPDPESAAESSSSEEEQSDSDDVSSDDKPSWFENWCRRSHIVGAHPRFALVRRQTSKLEGWAHPRFALVRRQTSKLEGWLLDGMLSQVLMLGSILLLLLLIYLAMLVHWIKACLAHGYMGLVLVSCFFLLRSPSGRAPVVLLRACLTLAIAAVTAAVTLWPWVSRDVYFDQASKTTPGLWGYDCNRHFDKADVPCHQYAGSFDYWVNVSVIWLLASIAMLCTASWHPASYHTRSSVHCVVLIWIQKLGLVAQSTSLYCEGGQSWLLQVAVEMPYAGEKLAQLWVQLLVYQRMVALESAMREPLGTGWMRGLLWIYGVLLLVEQLYLMHVPMHWRQCSELWHVPIPRILRTLILPALAVLYFRAFSKPLRILRMEADRMYGAVLAESLWARTTLRRELAVVMCTTFMSAANQAFQPFRAFGLSRFLENLHGIWIWPSALDDLMHSISLAVLCGFLFTPPEPSMEIPERCARNSTERHISSAWEQKVAELAGRGFELDSLLDFAESLLDGRAMPDFDPHRSTTNDVVRKAVIPLSRVGDGGQALATVWNAGQVKQAQRMVTHNWDNVFLHLVAAIIVDGIGEDNTYEAVASQLLVAGGLDALRQKLCDSGSLTSTYWVCAFCVNQHASICGGFGPAPLEGTQEHATHERKKRDAFGHLLPVCTCRQPKHFNSSPLECELNKFDDMMAYLSRTSVLKQVVAVDASFALFSRAWCVAELVEADTSCIPQAVVIHSAESLDQHFDSLNSLDVRKCEASRLEDRDFILQKIPDIDKFNARLQWLIFGSEGLLKAWQDSESRAESTGRIAGRLLRQAALRQE